MVYGPNEAVTHNQVSVTTTATSIRPAVGDRAVCTVRNVGSADCYLGSSSGVTSSTGFLLAAASKDAYDVHWQGAIYAITASGSSTVAYWEELT